MSHWKEQLRQAAEGKDANTQAGAVKRYADEEKFAQAVPDVAAFFAEKVIPAFEKIKPEVEALGRRVEIEPDTEPGPTRYAAQLRTFLPNPKHPDEWEREFTYEVRVYLRPDSIALRYAAGKRWFLDSEVFRRNANLRLSELTEQDVIDTLTEKYTAVLSARDESQGTRQ